MIKARTRPRMNVRPTEEVRIPSFLKWLRGRECIAAGKSGHVCQGRSEAHHVKSPIDASMGRKGPDSRCVPVCTMAHAQIHGMGAERFERVYEMVLLNKADDHWKAWPGRKEYELSHTHIENT